VKDDGFVRMMPEEFGLDILQPRMGRDTSVISVHNDAGETQKTMVRIPLRGFEIGVAGFIDIEAIHGGLS
jgi:hypothetical protein